MYIKKLANKMNKKQLECFLSKHRKFRLLTKDEMIEFDLCKKHTFHYDNIDILTGSHVIYLTYTKEYLNDLYACKDTIETLEPEDKDTLKRFFNKYVYK